MKVRDSDGNIMLCEHHDLGFSHARDAYLSVFVINGVEVNSEITRSEVEYGKKSRRAKDSAALIARGYEIISF